MRDRASSVLPTASYPDGEDVFQRWAAMGVAHFASLGAEVEPVLVRNRGDAADPAACQAIGEADLVYLSGGKPAHALDALAGSMVGRALLDANARGAVLAGCSAGAMALAGHSFSFRIRLLPWLLRWRPGLGFVPGASVVPHYDAWPEPLSALIALQSPRGSVVLGLDEDTGIVGSDGSWQVRGKSRVTVWRGRHRERYKAGIRSGSRAAPVRPPAPSAGHGQRPGSGGPGADGVRLESAGSVRLHLPEAVRAVDRTIHARLERDLGLVAARRADTAKYSRAGRSMLRS